MRIGSRPPCATSPAGLSWSIVLWGLGCVVLTPGFAEASIGYDPAGPLLSGRAPRTLAEDLDALRLSAQIGACLWLVLGVGALLLVHRLMRDLSTRVQVALALAFALIGYRLAMSAYYSPIRDGDELIDYAQVALAPFTGLRPVELIFPTGWTWICGALYALWLEVHVAALGANDLAQASLQALAGGLVWVRLVSTLACSLLGLAMARRVTLSGGVAGGLATLMIWLMSLPTTYLAVAAGPHAFAASLSWLGLLIVTAGPCSASRWTLVSGLWGFAIGSHPLALLVVACGLVGGWSSLPARRWQTLILIVIGLGVGFVVANPWLVEQWPAYVDNFRYRLDEVGQPEAVADGETQSYWRWFARHPAALGGTVAWLVFFVASRRMRSIRLAAGPVAGIAVAVGLGLVSTRFDRYLIWALPGIAMAAGTAVSELIRRMRRPKIDAIATGVLMLIFVLYGDLRAQSPSCPGGVVGYAPLVTVAQKRADGPIAFVFQAPQIERAVSANLISPQLAHGAMSALSATIGGNAQVSLAAYDQRKPLPAASIQSRTSAPVEIWELRWRRRTAKNAPLYVEDGGVFSVRASESQCGMLLRGAPLSR